MNSIKKNKNYIFINSNFITNFKPKIVNNLKKTQEFKNNNQIYCKNFLIFIMMIKYQNFIFSKSSLFFKKYKKNVYTVLRSPYRHKLARHQICINRYNINNSLAIKVNTVRISNWLTFINFIKFIKSALKIFESNLIFINNIKISIPFIFKENFFLGSFKK